MLSPSERKAIVNRIFEAVKECEKQQFKTQADIPSHKRDNIVVGEYPSYLDFSFHDDANEDSAFRKDSIEANGSTFMGLWFLTGSVPLIRKALQKPKSKLTRKERKTLEDAIASIEAQLRRARQVPKFFQGGSQSGTQRDINGCPRYTMGWYPLVGQYRIPAVLYDVVDEILKGLAWLASLFGKETFLQRMSNLSDGDIWSWCVAIEDIYPNELAYFGKHQLLSFKTITPLLNSYTKKHYDADDLDSWLNPNSIQLWEAMKHDPAVQGYPIETFWNPDKGPKGGFSCVVGTNMLAAFPLLGMPPKKYQRDIEIARDFILAAYKKALLGLLKWEEFAYDYCTIPGTPTAYLLRAHRSIEETKAKRNLSNYPSLLDHDALRMSAMYVAQMTDALLAKDENDFYQKDQEDGSKKGGNMDYATLTFCFFSMMNIWHVDPALYNEFFKADLGGYTRADLTAQRLLKPCSDAYDTPGTGPYQLPPFPIYVTMSSVCFVVPPLVEAYALYLLSVP